MQKILCLVVALSPLFSNAQVGIGTTNPEASAQLEVKSSGKGLLPPRVALQGTDDASKTTPTVPNPIAGLLVYNTTPASTGATAVTAGFYYYNGTAWVKLIVPTDNASNVTGTVAVENGGTAATTAAGARTNLGLGNVDNTSDANKPISTATQTALDSKAPINNPTFTGTVGGITKTMVGLGNVDNTSDANKPISTATQTALDSKAPINNPTFTGTVAGITKTMVGLNNVDNTSDANKPISTATQTALDLKENASNKSTSTALGTSDVFYPTQNAVKAYVDAQTTSDASSTIKGKVQLTGDLTGTAALPVIANAAINSAKLADGAVTTIKISDANITTVKIANANITTEKINDAAITTAKLADGAVTTTKITDANITTDKIADAAITDAKIATVSGSKVSGNISGNATNVTGTVAIANGGTAATTATQARTNLGATTVGSNLFTLTNPSAVTFPRINADNTVTALSAIDFRTAIGAGTGNGTVTSIGLATGTSGTDVNVSGSPVTGSGTITLNIPDASATARGLVTTGAQTFAGAKTFTLPKINTSSSTASAAGAGALRYNSSNLEYSNGSSWRPLATVEVDNTYKLASTGTARSVNVSQDISSGSFVTLNNSTITVVVPSGFSDTRIILQWNVWGAIDANASATGSIRYQILQTSPTSSTIPSIMMTGWSIASGNQTRFSAPVAYIIESASAGTYTFQLQMSREGESGNAPSRYLNWGVAGTGQVFVR